MKYNVFTAYWLLWIPFVTIVTGTKKLNYINFYARLFIFIHFFLCYRRNMNKQNQ